MLMNSECVKEKGGREGGREMEREREGGREGGRERERDGQPLFHSFTYSSSTYYWL